jgi:hypothetical protein
MASLQAGVKILVVALAAAALAPAASARTPLVVGVTEDRLKSDPARISRDAEALGIEAVRVTLTWHQGLVTPDAGQRAQLDAVTRSPLRIVVSVFGDRGRDAPQTSAQRDEYCGFLGRMVSAYPAIDDVVVWNEPNKELFWNPQYGPGGTSLAPARYEALLARCWDVLHDERGDIHVLGPSTAPRGNDNPRAKSNVSHSPQRFLEELAAAYRASGRDRPILDTLAQHVYGSTPGEPPGEQHRGGTIGEGDYAKLMDTLARGFRGTAQPVPDVWYLETGFETTVDTAKRGLYTGRELVQAIAPAQQAAQLRAAVRLAAAQPRVTGWFNFLLWDEPRLEGWQSGLYWADGSAKPSAAAFGDVAAAVQPARSSHRTLWIAVTAAVALALIAILLAGRRLGRRRRISR